MKNITFSMLLCASLLILNGCQRQKIWYLFLNCFVDIAPGRFHLEKDHKMIFIPVVSSHSPDKKNNDTEYLFIMIHGGGLNAEKTFETGEKVVKCIEKPKDRFLVVAPQFIEGVKVEEKGLLFWDRKWRSGGMSLSLGVNEDLPGISSFEAIDKLINVSIIQNPNIHNVVIFGHSAGGQFVVRYAATNNLHETLVKNGITIRYVVANPSSYPYLNETRYRLDAKGEILNTSVEELAECPDYNEYKYGMDNLYGYAKTLSKPTIQKRILTRPVIFLLGVEDTDRNWSLDKSCGAEAQGKNRYERGILYRHHLKSLTKDKQNPQHIWIEIPGVGHNAAEVFTHPEFISKLKTLDF